MKDITEKDIIYANNKVAGADFSKVVHPNHDPKDNDCICAGCMKILTKLSNEMYERIKRDSQ